MRNTKPTTRAFSLVELVIVVVIIGVIAAIAVPRISRGAKGADHAALRATLAGLRSAIDMYSAEHSGLFATGVDQTELENKLTKKTDVFGVIDPAGAFGPYLRPGFPAITVGAQKGKSTVKIIALGDPVPDGTTAWAYSTDTGTVIANTLAAEKDDDGVLYSDY